MCRIGAADLASGSPTALEDSGAIEYLAWPTMTVADVLQDEGVHLMPMHKPFDGYVEPPVRVSAMILIHFQCNRYSVPTPHAPKRGDHDQPKLCRMAKGIWQRKMTTALLDRLTHHCHIIETGNDSWRFKHSESTRKAPGRKSVKKGETNPRTIVQFMHQQGGSNFDENSGQF
jgi:hypothetical protein